MSKLHSQSLRHTTQAGFTLIELLVAISILIMLVGVGIAALVRQNDRQRLLQSARSAEQFLKIARARAQSKQTPTGVNGCAANESLTATQVVMSSNTRMDMYAVCTVTAGGPSRLVQYDNDGDSDTLFFPKNIAYKEGFPASSNPPNVGEGIQFITLSGGTNQSANVNVVMQITNTPNAFHFTVGRLGRIDEGEFCDLDVTNDCN